MEDLQRRARWDEAGQRLADVADKVQRAGAELLLLCTNTMHKLADTIQSRVGIPLLHIADATAAEVRRAGLQRVGLLGTRFTMEEDFYAGRLTRQHGLQVIIPSSEDRETVHRIIYEELCAGAIRAESRKQVAAVIHRLKALGAEGVILGCTELGLLLGAADASLPLFDSTRAHVLATMELAMKTE
jgi:aspartate racemase